MKSVTNDRTTYDLFISYADEDRDWVEGYLLDALCQAEVVCHHEAAFALGVPRLLEFERAVQQSARTLLVLSPAYFARNATNFVNVLAQAYGQETGAWPLIPLILEPVELPPRLNFVQALDMTDPKLWERGLERLCLEMQRGAPGIVAPPRCPYPGMTPFSEETSEFFFGRDEHVDRLLQRLRLERFMAVIGPSGSGKSSLVAAGLVPALRGSGLFGSGEWVVQRMRPGENPLGALTAVSGSGTPADPVDAAAAVLSASPPGSRLLLFVDQLEELFTVAGEGVVAFIDAMRRLAEAPQCYVVVTLRADFYPEVMASELWPLVSAHRFEILPLRNAELREAIVKPAEEVGVYVEGTLVERLLADADGEPGLLPLVQETMVCLWEKLERRLLPLRAYDALVLPHKAYAEQRGLHVALARQADATMSQLSPPRQAMARRIFLRLVQFGEGRSDVRRQQPVSALRSAGEDPTALGQVLEHLASRRLVTLSGDGAARNGERRVDLAHETLIAGWPAFRTWLDQRRDAEQTRRRLAAKAEEWVRLGGDGGLLDKVELLEAERWLEAPDIQELGVDDGILDLVAVSRQALEAEERALEAARQRELHQARALAAEQERRADVERRRADEQETAKRALGRRARALAVLTCVMLGAATFATVQQRRADRSARIAGSRAVAAQARLLADERLDLALLLAREAYLVSPTVEARGSLFAAVERHPRLTTFLHGHTERAGPAVFSPDGSLIASGGDDDRILLWSAATGQPIGKPLEGHTDDVRAVAFTPNGRTLASASHDRAIRLWDVATGQAIGEPITGHEGRIQALAVSPDGTVLASGGADQSVRLWDVSSRKVLAVLDQGSAVNSLDFSPDGRRLVATSDGPEPAPGDDPNLAPAGDGRRVVVWEVAGDRPSLELTGHTNLVRAAAFSPDGRLIASGGNDLGVRLWDASTGALLAELAGHTERIFGLDFSPDGRTLATGGRDRTVILWDVAQRKPLGPPLTGHSDSIRSVAFARNGTLLTAGDDRSVALWRLDVRHRLGQVLAVEDFRVVGVHASGDGHRVVTASPGTVRVWNATDHTQVGTDLRADEPVSAVAMSGNGRRVAAGTETGGVIIWDAESGERLLTDAGDGRGQTIAVALDATGRILAAGGQGGTLRRWDVGSRHPLGLPISGPDDWLSVALTADGGQLAAGARDGRVWFWEDATSSDPRGQVLSCANPTERLCGRPVQGVAFSPDGSRLVSGSADSSVSLWDPAHPRRDGAPLRRMHAHRGAVRGVAFSHDGRMVASAGHEGSFTLWDASTGQRLGDPVRHGDSVAAVAFGPENRSLVSASVDGEVGKVMVWNIDVESWLELACRVANRNLSADERRVAFGKGAARRPCPRSR